MKNALIILLALVANVPFAQAQPEDYAPEPELRGKPVQGGLIFGKATPGSKVWLDNTAVMVSPQGLFVIGFGRDETGTRTLRVEPQQFEAWEGDLTVQPREYDIERVDGLPPRTVTPDPEAAETHPQ